MLADNRSWLIPDWETTPTDEDPGAGEASEDVFQTQLSRLGCYLDPLRWSPSPSAAVETLLLTGFCYTKDKGRYPQYLWGCFKGLAWTRDFKVEEINPWMIAHLLRPVEDEPGGMVLVFPLLDYLFIGICTPVEVPLPALLEVVKKRAALGNVLEEVWVDDEGVDLSGLSHVQESKIVIHVSVRTQSRSNEVWERFEPREGLPSPTTQSSCPRRESARRFCLTAGLGGLSAHYTAES